MSEQKEFTLTITRDDEPKSTDKRFTMDDLSLGYQCEPGKTFFFQPAGGEKVEYTPDEGEHICNKTMARLACQVFEKQIAELSVEDRESFPVFQLKGPGSTTYGIYFGQKKPRGNRVDYKCKNDSNGRKFFLRYDNENFFSNIIFVQECLKRFGKPGDMMVLEYHDKHKKKEVTMEATGEKDPVQQFEEYKSMLLESKNLIFRGAPGTGKSYLAKEIAADIVSDGETKQLDEEQRKQVEFVQFHPSYDYTDFVEGLRPKVNDDGTMGFELQDGIFKKFIDRARKNYEDSQKPKEEDSQKTEPKKYVFIIDEINRGEISKIFGELFFSIDPGYRGPAGEISTQYSNLHPNPDEKFYIPENVYIIGTMNDIDRSVDSFDFAMRRRFRFVELKADDHTDMLSELKDKDLEDEAIERMKALNKEIAATEGLNENYQIGASYFLKLKMLKTLKTETETSAFDQLWTDYLRPLLQEYIRGMYDEEGIMKRFEKAYKKQTNGDTDKKQTNGDTNDAAQN